MKYNNDINSLGQLNRWKKNLDEILKYYQDKKKELQEILSSFKNFDIQEEIYNLDIFIRNLESNINWLNKDIENLEKEINITTSIESIEDDNIEIDPIDNNIKFFENIGDDGIYENYDDIEIELNLFDEEGKDENNDKHKQD